MAAGAISNSGTISSYSNRYMRGYAIMTGMSSTDASNLSTDYNALQTALTRNTY